MRQIPRSRVKRNLYFARLSEFLFISPPFFSSPLESIEWIGWMLDGSIEWMMDVDVDAGWIDRMDDGCGCG